MRRVERNLVVARRRVIATRRVRQEMVAGFNAAVAVQEERRRSREYQRNRSMEDLGSNEARAKRVRRPGYDNNVAESVSVVGGVVEEEWGVVPSLGQRVEILEEWRDNTLVEQERSREHRLAETDALLRLANGAREAATVFTGRWRREEWDVRGGGLPG